MNQSINQSISQSSDENNQSINQSINQSNNRVLLVHHSRDTPTKQWDETRMISINQSARVMRIMTENWSLLPDFQKDIWVTYMTVLRKFASHKSCEVATGAVAALCEVATGPSARDALIDSPSMARITVDTIQSITLYALEQANAIHQSVNQNESISQES